MRNKIQKVKENNFELTFEDFRKIIGSDWAVFQQKIIQNCYCSKCNSDYDSTIVDYNVTINNLNDIVLRGKCKKCGSRVNRYVESGENDKHKAAIEDVRKRYDKN